MFPEGFLKQSLETVYWTRRQQALTRSLPRPMGRPSWEPGFIPTSDPGGKANHPRTQIDELTLQPRRPQPVLPGDRVRWIAAVALPRWRVVRSALAEYGVH